MTIDSLAASVLVAVLVVLAWGAWTFNRLVRLRNGTDEGWATIDVELKRRLDLVPALVDAVRAYAAHERELFARVAEARARAVAPDGAAPDAPARDAAAQSTLTGALHSLIAVGEAYPALRASQSFLELQEELATTEDRLAYARGYYNAWVTDYEVARQSFPSRLVAALFRFPRRDFFEADVAPLPPLALRSA